MPPSAGPPKPVKKGQSSGSIIAGKDLTFSFSPEQKVAVREWLGVGMSVLEHQQNKQNDSSSHTTSLGLSSAAAAAAGGALSGSASLILAPSDSRESNPLSMGSFQLDQILAEKGTKNEEQFEQLALRILVRVVLALGASCILPAICLLFIHYLSTICFRSYSISSFIALINN